MTKTGFALVATLAAGWVLAGSAAAASAHPYRPGCNCGPLAPKTLYKTVHPARFETRFHDVSVTRHVHRVRRIVTVTRVQPIIHIHDVTRVHHHTVVATSNAYSNVTRRLAPLFVVQRSTRDYYDCNCGW